MEARGWSKAGWDGESLLMGMEFLFVVMGQHLVPRLEARESLWNSFLAKQYY